MRKLHHPSSPAPALLPPEDAIRDYAYHLYEQSGRAPGHDLDNWLEAEACLKANIPVHRSRARLHGFVLGLGPALQEELCQIPVESHNIGR
jgi:hypothetical protein